MPDWYFIMRIRCSFQKYFKNLFMSDKLWLLHYLTSVIALNFSYMVVVWNFYLEITSHSQKNCRQNRYTATLRANILRDHGVVTKTKKLTSVQHSSLNRRFYSDFTHYLFQDPIRILWCTESSWLFRFLHLRLYLSFSLFFMILTFAEYWSRIWFF